MADSKSINQFGLTEVYSTPDPRADVVFVHGLNGHPYNTWTTEKPAVFWPRDLLPNALQEQPCRILVYGYDANVTAFTDGASKDHIYNHAEHLASRLYANRSLRKAKDRPIIFVCHSLGGLVVKRCLIYSESLRHQHTEQLRSIYVSTYAILFLGTPHIGSDLAKWGSVLQSICSAVMPKKFLDTSPQLVRSLEKNNETLQTINRLFIEIMPRFRIYFFHESKPMDMKGTKRFVVEEDSAAPLSNGAERMGIERDHSHMCKFEDENAPGYDVVAEAIQRYAIMAPPVIRHRWDEENTIRFIERQAAAKALLISDGNYLAPTSDMTTSRQQISTSSSLSNSAGNIRLIEDIPSPTLSTRLPIAPFGFRPNSRFIGFESELDQLQAKLHDQKRLLMGTCAALVCGPPGCGKTHLAREYVWLHRTEYPEGCFWVDCKSAESRARGFWDIGQALAIHDDGGSADPDQDAADKFIHDVRRWFEHREGWLLVFDGIKFDTNAEIDTFRYFIPDCAGNNIIFTSTDRTLANRQRLLAPPAVDVNPLSEAEGCDLLFSSLELKRPSSSQRQKGLELVRRYNCLPLAIHAAAHVLLAKGRTLDKYVPSTSDQPIAGPFIEIIDTLREHKRVEAINLVTLLSFFSHAVPVALIYFGRAALAEFNVELRSVEGEGGLHREIDNSIITLIKHGLVQRTLLDYSVPSSSTNPSPHAYRSQRENVPLDQASSAYIIPHRQSSGSLDRLMKDPEPEELTQSSARSSTYSIDILRVHSYLQAVIRDDLKHSTYEGIRSDWWWLIAASRLLCRSYAVAVDKMAASSEMGLIRDFREYETQAAQLWSHYPKSSENVPHSLRVTRHDLHQTIRDVQQEIRDRSPSNSFTESYSHIHISVFERSSSASDSPNTPKSLAHASTWSLSRSDAESQSPKQEHAGQPDSTNHPRNWYSSSQTGTDQTTKAQHPSPIAREPSEVDHNDLIETGDYRSTSSSVLIHQSLPRQTSVIGSIFRGRHTAVKKHKDLGEWKPLPAPPSLSTTKVHASHSRSSSFSNASEQPPTSVLTRSEAETVLDAVHRSSTPPRTARPESSSKPILVDRYQNMTNQERQPLAIKSSNTRLSPLTQEISSGPASTSKRFPMDAPRHQRNLSSPRLAQAVLSNQAAAQANKFLPTFSTSENTSGDPSRPSLRSSSPSLDIIPGFRRQPGVLKIPSGYSSQPMSRDNSRDSNRSFATAPPAVPGSASLSTTPQIREPYLYSRPGPRSIDVATIQDIDFDQIGQWAGSSPDSPQTPTGHNRSVAHS